MSEANDKITCKHKKQKKCGCKMIDKSLREKNVHFIDSTLEN